MKHIPMYAILNLYIPLWDGGMAVIQEIEGAVDPQISTGGETDMLFATLILSLQCPFTRGL